MLIFFQKGSSLFENNYNPGLSLSGYWFPYGNHRNFYKYSVLGCGIFHDPDHPDHDPEN